jgi:AraC-like DNA-binding protein
MMKHVCRLEAAGRGKAADVYNSLQKKPDTGSLFLFVYSLSGKGKLAFGGGSQLLPEHHGCFLAEPADFRLLSSGGDRSEELLWLLASGDPVRGFWERFIRVFGHVVSLKRDDEPIRLLARMFRGPAVGEGDDRYRSSVRLYEWMIAVERLAEERSGLPQPFPAALQQVVREMENRVHDPLDLEEMAASAGLSKHHFCKTFKRHTGETPIHYMRKMRVEEAARLLRESDMSVARIADITGFDNISYFGKVFRRLTGETPTEFRDRNCQ